MGSIVLDDNKVNFNVIPNLTRAKNTIQDAYSTCNSLKNSLPSSFPSRSMVSSIATKISVSGRNIDDAKQKVTLKMEYVKRIESKSESKVSSLSSVASKLGTSLGMATGAVMGATGGIVGSAVGAATGAIAGKVAGTVVGKITETGAKVAKSVVSATKKVVTSVGTTIKETGSKIAKGIKSIWEKASGKVKEIANKTKDVVKTTFNKIKDTGAKVAKSVVSGAKKVVTATKDLAVKAGTAIAKGAKATWNGLTSTAKKIGNTVKTVSKKAIKAAKNTGAAIVDGVTSTCKKLWDGAKDLGKSFINGCKKVATSVKTWVDDKFLPGIKEIAGKIGNAVMTGLKWTGTQLLKVGASIANTVVALGEGIVGFAESLVDVVILAGGVVVSIPTAISDLVVGAIEGDLNWSATKTVWTKGVMPAVGYDATDKMFSSLYNTKVMKVVNDAAYKPFKRGELIYKVGEGIGYVAGVLLLTAATAGVGTAATSGASAAAGATSATSTVTANLATSTAKNSVLKLMTNKVATSSLISGISEVGESSQDNYNDLSDEEKQDLSKMMAVLGTSVIDGTVEGAAWYLTYSGGAKALSKSGNKVLAKVGSAFDGGHKTTSKAVLQASKSYINELSSMIIDGEFDGWGATEKAIVNAGTSIVYDVSASKWIKKASEKVEKIVAEKVANASNNFDAVDDVLDDIFFDKTSGQVPKPQVVSKFLEELNLLLKGTQSAGGKKVVGKGIKTVIKESMNDGIDAIKDLIPSYN